MSIMAPFDHQWRPTASCKWGMSLNLLKPKKREREREKKRKKEGRMGGRKDGKFKNERMHYITIIC